MAETYRFNEGDKVRIVLKDPSASTGVHEHAGEIVTIKEKCPFTWAYEVEEYPCQWWADGCFEKAECHRP